MWTKLVAILNFRKTEVSILQSLTVVFLKCGLLSLLSTNKIALIFQPQGNFTMALEHGIYSLNPLPTLTLERLNLRFSEYLCSLLLEFKHSTRFLA